MSEELHIYKKFLDCAIVQLYFVEAHITKHKPNNAL